MAQINDVFYEQLYARKKTVKEYVIQALIFLVTIALSMASFTFCITYIKGFGLIMGTLCIAVLVYFGYKLFMKLDVEYEYIYLNGEIDIDKIICRSERSRLVSAKSVDFEQFGEYNEETKAKVDAYPVNKRFDVRSNTSDKLYYAIFNHREYKKTLLIFEPEERILEDMRRHIQRSVWH
ncbi:MAG: hypothetical protein IJB44_00800 [Clostridia bacterium]|nr:hypothetical protein [Clostridia bacterium]